MISGHQFKGSSMKKMIFLIIALTLFISLLTAEESSNHSLSFNLGGPASIACFEYQYQLLGNERHPLSLSLGMGIHWERIAIPVGLTYAYGGRDQMLLAFHYVKIIDTADQYYYPSNPDYDADSFSFRIGYRKNFTVKSEQFFFQLFFSPLVKVDFSSLTNYIGLGFGAKL